MRLSIRRLVMLALVFGLIGCAGPLAIERALTDRAERDYREHVTEGEGTSREAFLAWHAKRTDISMTEALLLDDNLKSNPYRRDDAEALALGAAVYVEHCVSCHGFDSKGAGPEEHPDHPAKDFTSGIARMVIELNDGTPAHWFDAVYEGKGPLVEGQEPPELAMPAYKDKLSRREIWLTLNYIASRAASEE